MLCEKKYYKIYDELGCIVSRNARNCFPPGRHFVPSYLSELDNPHPDFFGLFGRRTQESSVSCCNVNGWSRSFVFISVFSHISNRRHPRVPFFSTVTASQSPPLPVFSSLKMAEAPKRLRHLISHLMLAWFANTRRYELTSLCSV